jgi:uncharacterized protein DUF4389
MSVYPVTYEQHPPLDRSRLTVFFRVLMAIPHVIWAFFYGLAFYVVQIIAWFAIVFTGHFPQGLYDFSAGYLRFYTRVCAYVLLLSDEYPPFDGGEHPDYAVRVIIGPPAAQYSRLKAFFRLILAIPIFILQYVMQIWLMVVAVGIWFVAVFTGKTPANLAEAMRFPASYYVRSSAYVYLMTDIYPSIAETETVPVPPTALPA